MRTIIALLLSLLAFTAHAGTDVAGVGFDEQTQLDGQRLVLNGAGLRTKFFFKVYAAGLYLPEHARSTDAVLAQPGPKRVDLTLLRDVSAETFVESLREGLRNNLSAEALDALAPRIEQFAATLLARKEAREGERYQMDFTPGRGTQLRIGDAAVGEPVPGGDFFAALLRIWIGDHPAQDDLKAALLGT